MSIDWLLDLERAIENGKEVFACPGISRNQWVIGKTLEELRRVAKRSAEHNKMTVHIVRIVSKNDTITGDLYLVPTNIGEPGVRGEPNIQWKTIETKEAAEMMRDVRQGPAPFFGMQVQESLEPSSGASV